MKYKSKQCINMREIFNGLLGKQVLHKVGGSVRVVLVSWYIK